jgi:hypothetical protein
MAVAVLAEQIMPVRVRAAWVVVAILAHLPIEREDQELLTPVAAVVVDGQVVLTKMAALAVQES